MNQQNGNTKKSFNEWLDKTFSPKGKVLFILIILGLIAACVFFGLSYMPKNDAGDTDVAEIEAPTVKKEKKVEEVEIDIEATEDKMVSVSVEDVGRADPFLPDADARVVTRPTSIDGYSLMAPPDNLNVYSDASRIMSTKVSGILYDAKRPSAILNIEGADYLVRTGDYINNYKVLSISKDVVTVQLGKNVYKAGVGQVMEETPINYNYVYDLSNRFGGAKK